MSKRHLDEQDNQLIQPFDTEEPEPSCKRSRQATEAEEEEKKKPLSPGKILEQHLIEAMEGIKDLANIILGYLRGRPSATMEGYTDRVIPPDVFLWPLPYGRADHVERVLMCRDAALEVDSTFEVLISMDIDKPNRLIYLKVSPRAELHFGENEQRTSAMDHLAEMISEARETSAFILLPDLGLDDYCKCSEDVDPLTNGSRVRCSRTGYDYVLSNYDFVRGAPCDDSFTEETNGHSWTITQHGGESTKSRSVHTWCYDHVAIHAESFVPNSAQARVYYSSGKKVTLSLQGDETVFDHPATYTCTAETDFVLTPRPHDVTTLTLPAVIRVDDECKVSCRPVLTEDLLNSAMFRRSRVATLALRLLHKLLSMEERERKRYFDDRKHVVMRQVTGLREQAFQIKVLEILLQ